MFEYRDVFGVVSPGRLLSLSGAVVLVDLLLLVGLPDGVATLARVALAGGALLALVGVVALGYRHSPPYGVVALLATPLAFAYAISGLVLPETSLSLGVSYWLFDVVFALPVVGEPLVLHLFGGFTISSRFVRTAFGYHYAIVGVVAVAVVSAWVARSRRSPGDSGRD